MNTKEYEHISVMNQEAVSALNVKENKIYVDCTFGRGGHSQKILDELKGSGHLYCFDQDDEAKAYFEEKFSKYKNCTFINANFANLALELNKLNVEKVDGFLFDLGVSSPMLDNPDRGFSYKMDAKLDMRMNQNNSLSAYEVVNQYPKDKLITIFRKYGDIKNPSSIVDNIVLQRKIKPIQTTLQLVEIIREKTPLKLQYQKKHFARTYFQALRIEVNNEIESLKKAIYSAIDMLNKKARIVTISFHSLEEKTIKDIYYEKIHENDLPKEIPINTKPKYKIIKVNKKANELEIEANNRSRSAFLKIFERGEND